MASALTRLAPQGPYTLKYPPKVSSSQSVTKQVASTTLNGATVKEVELSGDGRMWALVELNLSAVKKAAVDNAKKQEAMYNQFKANQSFDALEKAINEMK